MTSSSQFERYVGIDYSGAKTPTSRLAGIQVYSSDNTSKPKITCSPTSTPKKRRHWCRREVADWLVDLVRSGTVFVAGIDHGFSFPLSYFHEFKLSSWHEYLDDFCLHWPTAGETTVDSIRKQYTGPPPRQGSPKELRLTEKWTSSAKSVFLFDVQGSVAKSTHAGLPWLKHIRDQTKGRVHFWPFDGWQVPAGKCVLAEVYPSLFRRRYPQTERTTDEQDAYSISRWLAEADQRNVLHNYFEPSLTEEERQAADLEGWILGVL